MSYNSIVFQDDNYDEKAEKREKLLQEKRVLLQSPIANRFKIKLIDEALASLEEDKDYEEERGCATYLFK